MSNHLERVETWVSGTLLASDAIRDGANGVHNTLAIQGEPNPYVVLTLRGDPIVDTVLCGDIVSIKAVYNVEVVSVDTGFPRIAAVENSINDLLDNKTVEADGERARFHTRTISLARRIATGEKGMYFRAGGVFEFLILP